MTKWATPEPPGTPERLACLSTTDQMLVPPILSRKFRSATFAVPDTQDLLIRAAILAGCLSASHYNQESSTNCSIPINIPTKGHSYLGFGIWEFLSFLQSEFSLASISIPCAVVPDFGQLQMDFRGDLIFSVLFPKSLGKSTLFCSHEKLVCTGIMSIFHHYLSAQGIRHGRLR